MEIEFAFVCDYADGSGKLNALGIGFDTIYAPNVPFKHRAFSLVIKLKASVVEAGEKEIRIALIDDDGKSVIPELVSKLTLPRHEGLNETKANLVLQFGNVEFPHYGNYELKIVISRMEMGSIRLRVSKPPVTGNISKN
ncbi:MAG: hypothetical protein JW712_13480 [Dehalococcoidales bacterium]|nr:hypothetical protein [Dehalococcoidales bacterium]